MIPLTLEEIARAVDGTVHWTAGPGLTVTGPVVIDSREVTAGALFAPSRERAATAMTSRPQLTAPAPSRC
jgi:UDP-N-acetylmuramyl pentapeptide synthase